MLLILEIAAGIVLGLVALAFLSEILAGAAVLIGLGLIAVVAILVLNALPTMTLSDWSDLGVGVAILCAFIGFAWWRSDKDLPPPDPENDVGELDAS